MKFNKYDGNPILLPKESNPWEASVATNPTAWYDEENDEFILIYRAAGHDDKHMVVLGMAKSKDGFNFERCSDEPLFVPEATGPDAGCMEDPRIVKINTFRLELIPEGHLALIHNIDKPGSIGQIGTTLGRYNINIGRMQVGQEEEGDRNIIFMSTDTPIPPEVVEELRQLSLVKTVTPLEF